MQGPTPAARYWSTSSNMSNVHSENLPHRSWIILSLKGRKNCRSRLSWVTKAYSNARSPLEMTPAAGSHSFFLRSRAPNTALKATVLARRPATIWLQRSAHVRNCGWSVDEHAKTAVLATTAAKDSCAGALCECGHWSEARGCRVVTLAGGVCICMEHAATMQSPQLVSDNDTVTPRPLCSRAAAWRWLA